MVGVCAYVKYAVVLEVATVFPYEYVHHIPCTATTRTVNLIKRKIHLHIFKRCGKLKYLLFEIIGEFQFIKSKISA